MKVSIRDIKGKSEGYRRALINCGVEVVDENTVGDILLVDGDYPTADYHDLITRHKAGGSKVLVYPHAPNTALIYSVYKPHKDVDGFLAYSHGYARALMATGYDKPVYVTGWTLSPVRQFSPTAGQCVLFAPIHPRADGFLMNTERRANQKVFEQLLRIPEITLMVRHVGALRDNGLWHMEDVRFILGVTDNSYNEILDADIVVAGGTYGFIALAMGKPTVMMCQGLASDISPEPFPYGDRHEFARYPLDALPSLRLAMARAARGHHGAYAWRQEFIGDPMNGKDFTDLLVGIHQDGSGY